MRHKTNMRVISHGLHCLFKFKNLGYFLLLAYKPILKQWCTLNKESQKEYKCTQLRMLPKHSPTIYACAYIYVYIHFINVIYTFTLKTIA